MHSRIQEPAAVAQCVYRDKIHIVVYSAAYPALNHVCCRERSYVILHYFMSCAVGKSSTVGSGGQGIARLIEITLL